MKNRINIGLEVHVELATKTKIFCGCSTEFGGKVNSHTCPVCMALPGTLPVLNKKVVELACGVGIATNCNITRECRFDRKNYFYPDNPQNYQISQLYLPICTDGYIEINTKEGVKKIGIHEIHMEEDAGKLIHDENEDISLIDYNRAGVPLIEIVSKPDMNSADEVIEYLEELRTIIRYLDASDCKLNEGSMRADVNLSIKNEDGSLGTRTEMKNLNSFKAIRRAIEHETKRQLDIIESGQKVMQETRRWDDGKDCSFAMRSKEDSNDYRYFPEPDLVSVVISNEWLEDIKKRQPELRKEKKLRYKEMYGLPDYDIDILTSEKNVAEMFEKVVSLGVKAKKASNWIMVDTFKILNDKGIPVENLYLNIEMFSKLILMVENKKITKSVGVEILEIMFDKDIDPEKYAEEKGLAIVEDIGELEKVIDEIFDANPQSIEDYKNGKTKAMGYLIGQTMKAMKGKASPDKVNEIVYKKLNIT